MCVLWLRRYLPLSIELILTLAGFIISSHLLKHSDGNRADLDQPITRAHTSDRTVEKDVSSRESCVVANDDGVRLHKSTLTYRLGRNYVRGRIESPGGLRSQPGGSGVRLHHSRIRKASYHPLQHHCTCPLAVHGCNRSAISVTVCCHSLKPSAAGAYRMQWSDLIDEPASLLCNCPANIPLLRQDDDNVFYCERCG